MDLNKTIVVLLLTLVLLADVISSRPVKSSSEIDILSAEETLLEALVALEDQRIHGSSRHHQRHNRNARLRRNTMTGTMALMETCLKQPAKCQELLKTIRQNNSRTVIVIEK